MAISCPACPPCLSHACGCRHQWVSWIFQDARPLLQPSLIFSDFDSNARGLENYLAVFSAISGLVVYLESRQRLSVLSEAIKKDEKKA